MIIKLLSTQIPQYWEIIKSVATAAERIEEEDLPPYLNWFLHLLLSDKAQCWVRLDEDRMIIALLLTQLLIDKITAKKSLHLRCVFSFKHVPPDVWQSDFDLLVQFAKQEKCNKITVVSQHSRIWEIVTDFGCKEAHRFFVYNLE